MTVKEILIEARNIISDEKNWTKGAYYRDENGGEVSIWDQSAVCFCLIGAVNKAFRDYSLEQPCDDFKSDTLDGDALAALANELKTYSGLADFNDYSSHKEVLALFDKAVANCCQ